MKHTSTENMKRSLVACRQRQKTTQMFTSLNIARTAFHELSSVGSPTEFRAASSFISINIYICFIILVKDLFLLFCQYRASLIPFDLLFKILVLRNRQMEQII